MTPRPSAPRSTAPRLSAPPPHAPRLAPAHPRAPCPASHAACWPVLALLLLGPLGCRSASVPPIPAPLPLAREWALPAATGAFLGLHTEENDSGSLDNLFFLPGLRVLRVVENSPAARAGLQPGDTLLAWNDIELHDPAALDARVDGTAPDTAVELKVQRGDTVFGVPVTLQAAGEPAARARPLWRLDPARSRAGWITTPRGVLLASAHDDSPFPRAGVALGDRVLALDGQPVLSDRDLIRRLQQHEPGASVQVDVEHADGRQQTLWVQLQQQPTRLTGFGLPLLVAYDATSDGASSQLSLLDLWVFQLFQYEREGQERRWQLLELFGFPLIRFSAGVGELTE